MDRSQGRTGGFAVGDNRNRGDMPGNRALQLEEPLLFEKGRPEVSGVDLPDAPDVESRLGGLERKGDIGLPGLSEPELIRHFTRLSQKNYGIDSGLFPLGSCTMKHNPRLNEKVARMTGLGDLHPMQPRSTVQGALALIDQVAHWLKVLTGAGHRHVPRGRRGGGMMCVKAAINDRGGGEVERRARILVPESAHGTNPATATACGFTVDPIPANDRGRVDLDAMKAKLGDDVAGIMLTNPNTCGLFETDIIAIADAIHEAGGYFYCDGANFNAIVGRVRPGDLGIDCMHINLHKTFSTPTAADQSGAVRWFVESWPPSRHCPTGSWTGWISDRQTRRVGRKPFGRLKGFHGQMGMFIRALAYMLSHGSDGLKQVAEDAVLNANYALAKLSDDLSPSFDGPCMHEALFDDGFLKGTNVSTLDFAKAMIDEGYHPMTMYFPLVVHGAMLVEPTETETRADLDAFIDVVATLAKRAKAGEARMFKEAPALTPRRRLDETGAARRPVLRWTPPAPPETAR